MFLSFGFCFGAAFRDNFYMWDDRKKKTQAIVLNTMDTERSL